MCEEHRSGRTDYLGEVWGLLVANFWLRKYELTGAARQSGRSAATDLGTG
jgi:hypothetical protein